MSTVSSARVEANRRNAQLSTGPRTPDGKARSSQNGVTLGLYSKQLLLAGEDPQQLQQLRDGLVASLQPADVFEELLVDRIVSAAWKLQRLARAEQVLFLQGTVSRRNALPEEVRAVLNLPPRQPVVVDGQRLLRYPALPQSLAADVMQAETNPALEKLQKHERHFENAILRWTKELRMHRKGNRSEPASNDENRKSEPTVSDFAAGVIEAEQAAAAAQQQANAQTEPNLSAFAADLIEAEQAVAAKRTPTQKRANAQTEPKPQPPIAPKPAALIAAATSAVSTLRLGEDRMDAMQIEDLILKQLVQGANHASRKK